MVDPGAWTWTDARWKRVRLRDLVLLEVHVGTFTAEGTFDAAIGQLERLRDIGITGIELLPIAAFPGERGWGYDGVYPWSAQAAYGGPDGLQRLVDAAHAAGIAVILDVVPNHVGASGERAARVRPVLHRALLDAVGSHHEGVERDRGLDAGHGRPNVLRHLLDRDVHHRLVERHQELAGGEREQDGCEPAAALVAVARLRSPSCRRP